MIFYLSLLLIKSTEKIPKENKIQYHLKYKLSNMKLFFCNSFKITNTTINWGIILKK